MVYIYIFCNINQMRISYNCKGPRTMITTRRVATKWYGGGRMHYTENDIQTKAWQPTIITRRMVIRWVWSKHNGNESNGEPHTAHRSGLWHGVMTAEGLLVGETAEDMNWKNKYGHPHDSVGRLSQWGRPCHHIYQLMKPGTVRKRS